MAKFVIQGGQPLAGTIRVGGSKNAALPLLAAALLTKQPVRLSNIPNILDVRNMIVILSSLGATITRDANDIVITATDVSAEKLATATVSHLRGSILLLGALLGRMRQVKLPMPGGDIIGARPIDVHLDGFRQLGATVTSQDDYVSIDGSTLTAGVVILREFSVTATENIMMAAATLSGTTTIKVAATEPHVVALGYLLQAMGATISGLGTHTINITGAIDLTGATFTNIPDMLEAGLFIMLAAATKSRLTITEVPVDDLPLFFKKIEDIGIKFTVEGSAVSVTPAPLKPFKMQSLPQPGIPTDLQAPFAVVATQATGTSLIHDPMYEGRFRHCDELAKMGASITVCDPHRVVIEGPTPLRGQHIRSLDIRSGATLIMAGLLAKGETVIDDAEIIDRGYENLAERLQAIGANIARTDVSTVVDPVVELHGS